MFLSLNRLPDWQLRAFVALFGIAIAIAGAPLYSAGFGVALLCTTVLACNAPEIRQALWLVNRQTAIVSLSALFFSLIVISSVSAFLGLPLFVFGTSLAISTAYQSSALATIRASVKVAPRRKRANKKDRARYGKK